jgi:hypothetical protein
MNGELRKVIESMPEDELRLRQKRNEWGGAGSDGHSFVSEWLREREESESFKRRARSDQITIIATLIGIIAAAVIAYWNF